MTGRPLGREFFAGDSRVIAPQLLHKLLVRGTRVARIVEVEAYAGVEDPGSHGYRGPTARTEVMFGPPGHLYVYFTYGMHWCANVVCGPDGVCSAVLLRAAEPLEGLPVMRRARGRGARRVRDLCSGPAKLCQAFGIDGRHDGTDIVAGTEIELVTDGTRPPPDPIQTGRVGLSQGADHPWRWYVPDSAFVS